MQPLFVIRLSKKALNRDVFKLLNKNLNIANLKVFQQKEILEQNKHFY